MRVISFRLQGLIVLMCLCAPTWVGVLMWTPAQAGTGWSIAPMVGSYAFQGSTVTAFGLEAGLPLTPIPLLETRVQVVTTSGSDYTLIPASFHVVYRFPVVGVFLGGGAGVVFYSNKSATTVPLTGIYSYYVGYDHAIAPLLSIFGQGGYEVVNIDYKVGAATVKADFSGVSVKGGVRLGF